MLQGNSFFLFAFEVVDHSRFFCSSGHLCPEFDNSMNCCDNEFVVTSYSVSFSIDTVHSFFILFLKSGINKSTEWSMIPACPSPRCFFNRDNTEGTDSLKILCLIFTFVLFYINLCQD